MANGTAFGRGVYTGHSPNVSLGYTRGTSVILACLMWHDAKVPITAVTSEASSSSSHSSSHPTSGFKRKGWNTRGTHRTSTPSSNRVVKKMKRRLAAEQAAYVAALRAFQFAAAVAQAAPWGSAPQPPVMPPKLAALAARMGQAGGTALGAHSSPYADRATVFDATGQHYVSNRLSVVQPTRVIPAFYYQQPTCSGRHYNRHHPFKVPQTWRELVRAHGRATVGYVTQLRAREVAVRRLRGSRDARHSDCGAVGGEDTDHRVVSLVVGAAAGTIGKCGPAVPAVSVHAPTFAPAADADADAAADAAADSDADATAYPTAEEMEGSDDGKQSHMGGRPGSGRPQVVDGHTGSDIFAADGYRSTVAVVALAA